MQRKVWTLVDVDRDADQQERDERIQMLDVAPS